MRTRAVRWSLPFVLFVAVFAVSPLAAQQAPESNMPVIRANARLVLVDAVVTDRSGKYVHDLTAKDFKVYEDGKERDINSFSMETSAAEDPRERRYIALFFDNRRIPFGDQQPLRDAAIRFIDANAGPNRVIAVINYDTVMEVAQNFTIDAERLKKAVAHFKAANVSRSRSETFFSGEQSRRDPNSLPPYFHADVRDFAARSRLEALRDLATRLAPIRGRKAIVLFTPGIDPSQKSDMDTVISACNKANVAVYMIGTTGAESNKLVDALAEGTGGFSVINPNAFGQDLQRVADDVNEYYLMGFRPATSQDGSCHNLQVKVERSGVKVRSRSQYCNVKPQELLAGSPAEQELMRRLSGTEQGKLSAAIQTPYFFTSPNIARVNLTMEIPPDSLKVAKEKGKLRASVNVLGIAYKPDGTVGARFSDTLAREFENKEDLERFRSAAVHYEKQFEVASGQYTFKVVFGSEGGSFGRFDAPLNVDSYDAQHFALSSLVLSNRTVQLADASGADQSLSEGDTPLLAHGSQIVPSASNRFKKSDQLLVYSEVYEPGMNSATPPIVVMKYRVVDRTTHDVEIDSGLVNVSAEVQKGSGTIPVAYVVPLNKLAPGKYVLTAHAGDSAGSTSTLRSVAFEVE